MVLLLLSIAFDLLQLTGNDLRLRAFYPCRIHIPPASETSCYMDIVSLLQQAQITAVSSLPGGHDVPGRFYDRAAVATLVAIIGRNAHRCKAQLVREPDVSLAWLRVPAWMVVQLDDSTHVVEQGLPQHCAAVDEGQVQRAPEKGLEESKKCLPLYQLYNMM